MSLITQNIATGKKNKSVSIRIELSLFLGKRLSFLYDDDIKQIEKFLRTYRKNRKNKPEVNL